MDFEAFQARATEMFDSIPPEFREGVDGLVVEAGVQRHPELPGIYTMGECRTEQYPSEYGGPGTVRSFVVLFYGSFVRVADDDPEWDWEGELWETITHEVKHHLESLASEDDLEVEDWVMDQNFARRKGKPFEPLFFREGVPLDEGVFEVDGDVFLEREIDAEDVAAGALVLEWEEHAVRVPLPEEPGEVHFLTVEGLPGEEEDGGEVVVVLLRKRGMWESLRAALGGRGAEVRESRVRAEALE